MVNRFLLLAVVLFVQTGCSDAAVPTESEQPLAGINITVDPGHGDSEAYDEFRVGPAGEREEWINLRVAERLAGKLESAGANVLMTRKTDKDVSLGGRAALTKKHDSHLLVSVHHNGAGNDTGIDLPIVYFFGAATMNPASVDFAHILLEEMASRMTFSQPRSGAVYSDHIIYSSGTSILRNTVDVLPGVIGEGGFFTNPEGEARLRDEEYNALEADVYYRAILKYFERGRPQATLLPLGEKDDIAEGQVLAFRLDDGFGAHGFREDTLAVLQDGIAVRHDWDAGSGVLSVHTAAVDSRTLSIRVFGRNLKGNALHPRVFRFVTGKGKLWNTHELWSDAFEEAESVYSRLSAVETLQGDTELEQVDESLRLYRLSLELQLAHPHARRAEEQILALLQLKDSLVDEDLSDQVAGQRERIEAYYPLP